MAVAVSERRDQSGRKRNIDHRDWHDCACPPIIYCQYRLPENSRETDMGGTKERV